MNTQPASKRICRQTAATPRPWRTVRGGRTWGSGTPLSAAEAGPCAWLPRRSPAPTRLRSIARIRASGRPRPRQSRRPGRPSRSGYTGGCSSRECRNSRAGTAQWGPAAATAPGRTGRARPDGAAYGRSPVRSTRGVGSPPVTYDIALVRVQPGLTLQETLDRLNAGFDPAAELPPLRLTDTQRAEWDRVLARVSRDIGPVESEEFLYSLMLETAGPPGRVQLDYHGDTAHIEIAYRCSGPAALEVMRRIRRRGRTDLRGTRPQDRRQARRRTERGRRVDERHATGTRAAHRHRQALQRPDDHAAVRSGPHPSPPAVHRTRPHRPHRRGHPRLRRPHGSGRRCPPAAFRGCDRRPRCPRASPCGHARRSRCPLLLRVTGPACRLEAGTGCRGPRRGRGTSYGRLLPRRVHLRRRQRRGSRLRAPGTRGRAHPSDGRQR